MNREEKAAAVAELSEELKLSEAVFAIDYRGISVTESAELRGKLTEADAVFKVVKNRLAKLAAADAGTDGIDELLVGPTALTLIRGDAVLAAKAIADFAKQHEELEYKGGIMDGAALDPDGFNQIARLPGLDVLRGQLTGLAASPLTGLAAGMSNLLSGLGRQLSQIAEQGLVSGEPPAAEEAPAEEPAAEEAPAEEPAAAEAPAEEPAAAEETPADAPAEEPADTEEPAEEPTAEEPTADEPAAEDSPAEESAPEAEEAPAADETASEPTPDPDAPGSEPEAAAGSDSETDETEESTEESEPAAVPDADSEDSDSAETPEEA